jgi:tRNA A-37 threonylcarbamoyl transferase component Bud32
MKNESLLIPYGDRVSGLALWWKSFFLVPAWVYPVLIIFGVALRSMGELAFNFGFILTLMVGCAYFISDLLKRKIRIEHGVIFHGLRAGKLSELSSIGLSYRQQEIVPRDLCLNFNNGDCLKLKLSRLTSRDCDALIRCISRTVPSCSVDPTLRALARVKQVAQNSRIASTQVRLFRYESNYELKELTHAFMTTFDAWARMGPLMVFILGSPIWFNALAYVLVSGSSMSDSIVVDLLRTAVTFTGMFVAKAFASFATGTADIITRNNVLVYALMFLLVAIVGWFGRLMFKPNQLRLDAYGLQIRRKLPGMTFTYASLPWTRVQFASLEQRNESKMGKLRLHTCGNAGHKQFDVDLGAIAEGDRQYFIESLEEFAPHCQIESELAETVLPSQERSYTELWLQSLTAAPERKSLEPLSAGQILGDGRYEILRKLGSGGQGMAYLCNELDRKTNAVIRQVVLKETIIPIFGKQSVRQQAIERFGAEAKMLSQFDDDRIVRLLAHFIEDHRGYLVLEHIPGKTLRQLVESDGALSEAEVRGLALQMCDILNCLHEKGIIHRDFTPDNLIVTGGGRLKLIDFNVAQEADSGITGTVVGKHAYLPPEQIRGLPVTQSDIYGMGATLFFALTGRDPEPISICSPLSAGAEVSPEMDAIVSNCTQLAVEKRFQDSSGIKFALTPADSMTINIAREQKEEVAVDG